MRKLLLVLLCLPMIGFGQFLCSQLAVYEIVIDSANMTIDIAIYDGNIGGQPYPYIAYTIDNIGDTIQTGSLNSFGNSGLDTSWYSYTLNSFPNYPLTIYYVYGICSTSPYTCILTYNITSTINNEIINSNNRKLIKTIDLTGRETKQTNQPLLYLYDDGTVEKRITID